MQSALYSCAAFFYLGYHVYCVFSLTLDSCKHLMQIFKQSLLYMLKKQTYQWSVEHQNLLFILFGGWGFQCCCCPFDLVWVAWLTSFYSCYKCTGIFMFNQSSTFLSYNIQSTKQVHKHFFLGPCRKGDFFQSRSALNLAVQGYN